MSRFRIFALLGLLGVAQSALAQPRPFTIHSITKQQVKGIARTRYIVQNGDDPLNRFSVERVVLARQGRKPTRPVILQPPITSTATGYTLSGDPHGYDFSHSVADDLARGGLDLYIYSPRETFLTPGQCANQEDCAAAKDWGFAAVLDDLRFTRWLVRRAHPGVKPVIGGYSLGGGEALAAVNEKPDAYAGIFIGDGGLVLDDPAQAPGYGLLCQGLSAAIAAGQVVDDQFAPLLHLIVQLAVTAPNDPSPLPLFPAGTTNRQAYILFFSTPSPGPPSSLFPTGLIFSLGSLEEDRLYNVSESRLNTTISSGNIYVANATLRDISCSWAGDPAFFGNLASYTGPILAFEAGLGFGDHVNDSIEQTGSTDVRVESYPSFGHTDLPASPSRKQLFSKKILNWVYNDVSF